MPLVEREKIMQADLWPYGVCVQKLRGRTGNRDANPQTLKHGRNEHIFL